MQTYPIHAMSGVVEKTLFSPVALWLTWPAMLTRPHTHARKQCVHIRHERQFGPQVGWEECKYDAHKRPAIGSEALHQVRALLLAAQWPC